MIYQGLEEIKQKTLLNVFILHMQQAKKQMVNT